VAGVWLLFAYLLLNTLANLVALSACCSRS